MKAPILFTISRFSFPISSNESDAGVPNVDYSFFNYPRSLSGLANFGNGLIGDCNILFCIIFIFHCVMFLYERFFSGCVGIIIIVSRLAYSFWKVCGYRVLQTGRDMGKLLHRFGKNGDVKSVACQMILQMVFRTNLLSQ